MRLKQLFFITTLCFISFNIFGQAASTSSVKTEDDKMQISSNALKLKDILPNNNTSKPTTLDISTNHFKIIFSSVGGNIISLKHRDYIAPLKDNVELVNDSSFRFELYKTPSSLIQLDTAHFNLTKTETSDYIEITAQTFINGITDLNKSIPLSLSKKYRFYKQLYYWQYSIEFNNNTGEELLLNESYFIVSRPIGPMADKNSSVQSETSYYNFYYTKDTFTSIPTTNSGSSAMMCSSHEGNSFVDSPIDFLGSSSRFMIMLVQPKFSTAGIHIFTDAKEIHTKLKPLIIKAKQSTSLDFIVYTGPKEKEPSTINFELKNKYSFLKDAHEKFYTAFNFGFTAPIRDIIISILDLLHKVTPNYGIAIILFSILFKLIFFPLNQKQATSMKKMSELQPQLKKINEQFKNNPQEKQRKIMTLYKENKVNPLSGCLPILIQIPIFIALYAAFSDSYHLWRSPFIEGWINDLSEPDTVYIFATSIPVIGGFHLNILPILMGLTQFIQTKMTVTVGDASQQKIMLFMPLILLFFFWNLPSGVVLYWTVQNILSIIQQMYTNYKK